MRLDLLLRDARVLTMDPHHPRAHTLGIWNGRVVGVDEDVEGASASRVLDLDGAAVTPGFCDAHAHTAWFGLGLSAVDLAHCATVEEILDAVASRSRELPADAWVVGVGYDHNRAGGRHPHRRELDRAGDGRPVWLKHTSGHLCVVSTAVLDLAKEHRGDLVAPAGGVVDRDRAGDPTGLLEEQAQRLVQDLVLPYSLEEIAEAIDLAGRRYLAEGVTTCGEAGIGGGWIGNSPLELAAYQLARDTGRLHTRMRLMVASDALHPVSGHDDDGIVRGLDLGIRTGLGDDSLSLGAVKVFTDGSMLGQTAAMTEPYCGHDDRCGYLQQDASDLLATIVDAHCAGWQVAVHAIGDRAVDLALDAIEQAQQVRPRSDVRHRIEHGGVIRPDQVARLRAARVSVVPQPNFIATFGDTMAASLGPRRTTWAYRAASLLAAGVPVAGSSDRPVAPGAPLAGIQAMTLRRTETGQEFGPEERVSAEAALYAYTVGAAYACNLDHAVGSLTPSRWADLVVLEDDPTMVDPTQIASLSVLATFLAGRPVHDAAGLAAQLPTSTT